MEKEQEKLNESIKEVTRVEVISNKNGRQFVKLLDKTEHFEFQLQDNNKTLKIFVNDR